MLSSPVIGQGLPHAKLDSLLSEMHDKDQNIRREMIDASQNEDYDPFYYANKMDSIDSANQEILSCILDSVGWPDNLSEKANTGIFLVIDHATKEYSEKYLELVESQADNGLIPKDLYATLYDRILMKNGKKQVYGTQSVMLPDEDGNSVSYIWPVEDADNIDEIRLSVGLNTLEEYMRLIEDAYHVKCIWDKDLKVVDIPYIFK